MQKKLCSDFLSFILALLYSFFFSGIGRCALWQSAPLNYVMFAYELKTEICISVCYVIFVGFGWCIKGKWETATEQQHRRCKENKNTMPSFSASSFINFCRRFLIFCLFLYALIFFYFMKWHYFCNELSSLTRSLTFLSCFCLPSSYRFIRSTFAIFHYPW